MDAVASAGADTKVVKVSGASQPHKIAGGARGTVFTLVCAVTGDLYGNCPPPFRRVCVCWPACAPLSARSVRVTAGTWAVEAAWADPGACRIPLLRARGMMSSARQLWCRARAEFS